MIWVVLAVLLAIAGAIVAIGLWARRRAADQDSVWGHRRQHDDQDPGFLAQLGDNVRGGSGPPPL